MSPEEDRRVLDALASLGLDYARRDHPPAATVEDAVQFWQGLPGVFCKNLFLRNKKGNHHYLVIAEHRRPIDLKALAKLLRDDRLSFASDERLARHLGVTPGAVSPFGLINDEARAVVVIVDEGLRGAEFLSFHPNVNTSTLTITRAAFEAFLAWRGNPVRYVRF
ncbi:MAG: prolyl-tRNA synthetase associated domain-containing protein [Acidobacteriota bacterium]|nr:prolyl-tRNA synthetase associated domain-containing protein [Acidobacteriota bacterium]